LVQQLLQCGPKQAADAIRQGRVLVNGRPVRQPRVQLDPGDRLSVRAQEAPVQLHCDQPVSFEVHYEDDDLIVVTKPAGLLTVPTSRNESTTLLGLLARRLSREGRKPHCVHRLDRGVSGLLVFAKHESIADRLRDQFAERKPERLYLAFVRGAMQSSSGTIRSYLATDERLNRFSTPDESIGQLAITHYRVLEVWSDFASKLELQLETGRRNQIRVHLAEAGHPLWGDARYGGRFMPHRYWPYQRVALHAARLGFQHPVTGRTMHFASRTPQEFTTFERRLRESF
jgi:23S rRNA pseudouridine1911/1915/1917 synthase